MDIKRLKELRGEVSNVAFIALSKLVDKNARANVVKFGEDLQELIDETIARQSVKSEEVAEAIEWLTNTGHSNQYMSGEWTAPMRNHITRKIQETILAALQAYEPWISVKDRLPEPITKHSGFDVNNVYLVATFEGCNPNGYFYGYELARYWGSYWSSIDGSRGLSVTHWKPLPEPPEERDDGC